MKFTLLPGHCSLRQLCPALLDAADSAHVESQRPGALSGRQATEIRTEADSAMKTIRQRISRAIGAMALAACATGALADAAYPARPIRMIVPWPAGGSVDIATRIVTERASAGLGQPIIESPRRTGTRC